MNPQHTVPTLNDAGYILWDSHAINAYLVGMYGLNDFLYPSDLKKRAIVDQRLHFDSNVLYPCFTKLVSQETLNTVLDKINAPIWKYYKNCIFWKKFIGTKSKPTYRYRREITQGVMLVRSDLDDSFLNFKVLVTNIQKYTNNNKRDSYQRKSRHFKNSKQMKFAKKGSKKVENCTEDV